MGFQPIILIEEGLAVVRRKKRFRVQQHGTGFCGIRSVDQ